MRFAKKRKTTGTDKLNIKTKKQSEADKQQIHHS